jgi:Flp pilus assembly protein TadG
MRLLRSLLRFKKANGGAALVEFTLTAPLLILLMCGMAEFSNAMRQYHIMEKSVRDAGRYLARVPMSGCAIDGSAATAATNLVLTGRTASGGAFLLPTWTDPTTVNVAVAQCVNNSAGTYRGRAQMPVIQVTASAPYSDVGLLSILGFSTIQLQVSHQQLWIGS